MNQGVKASSSVYFWGNFGARLSTSMVQAFCRWMNPTHTQNPLHYVCTQTEHPIHHIRHSVDIIIIQNIQYVQRFKKMVSTWNHALHHII